jgi:cytochrome c
MKRFLLLAAIGTVIAMPAWSQDADAALKLSQKSNCAACHAVDKKLVGPSWTDIGKKYGGDAGAEAKLVTKAKKGGVGVWGQVPMPPNVTVKDADIQVIVKYALSLK